MTLQLKRFFSNPWQHPLNWCKNISKRINYMTTMFAMVKNKIKCWLSAVCWLLSTEFEVKRHFHTVQGCLLFLHVEAKEFSLKKFEKLQRKFMTRMRKYQVTSSLMPSLVITCHVFFTSNCCAERTINYSSTKLNLHLCATLWLSAPLEIGIYRKYPNLVRTKK